jgi:RsiW-degrading membrane proteinase PrsW (M82 family)
MFRTIYFGLVFFLLGVAGASFYWIGSATENAAMKSVAFLLSGVMLMIAILIAAVIKTFEDRERKLLEGKDPDRP